MSIHRKQAAWFFFGLLLVSPPVSHAAAPANGQIEVTGTYRYVFHDPETTADALNLACREAWRLAIVESPMYREQTASVVDSTLLRDIANNLVTRYLRDQQILEQTERGRTVSCRVRGVLAGDESAKAIRTQLAGGPPTAESLDQNRTLRIVSVKEEGGYLLIEFQALKRLDWLNTAYQGSLRESADIMVDFYDAQGILIRTERHPARQSGTNNTDVLNPGMLGLVKVSKPFGAKTYRVWLVK